MIRLPKWKVVLVILAVIFGVVFSLPNVLPDSTLKQLPGWIPHNRINLGLDLQGGSYLLYEVDTAALKAEKLTNLTEDVRNTLQQKQIAASQPTLVNGLVDVRITDPAQIDTAFKDFQNLGEALPNGGRDIIVTNAGDQHIHLALSDQAMQQEAFKAVDHGYSLAYPSIIDANLTSLISAFIMMEIGSGAGKGFAWTLTIGVISSVFTAILVTQVLIGWWFRMTRPKKLPI